MTGNEIRRDFIKYFESKGHKHVRSSSLVPHNDPTILFTNAGMNQFKDFFLGNQTPEYKCAVSSQKVMRAGGKHNDLENVGHTDRHHTFFEMLGNFSFGDYFKKEAILYAWEFLTVNMGIDQSKLAVSVFHEDQEAYDLWKDEVGISEDRIARLGAKDNFWSMGDTGPCGPCSEIHFLIQPLQDGKTMVQSLEDDDGSFLEIWNLVFMQFNRAEDGTMSPLPNPCVDTGAGLERVASVVQGVTNNYDVDLFKDIMSIIANKAKYTLGTSKEGDISCRVIADHLRAVTFLIADGVIPSNEGRGYVLRRIIRRAARYGSEFGFAPGFFSNLVDEFVPTMKDDYPEIEEAQNYVKILLMQEEKRFSATLNQGMKIINTLLEEMKKSGSTEADGREIFKLYDTFGFPYDLAEDILRDHGFTYNKEAFSEAMEEQRERAKAAGKGSAADLKVSEVYIKLLEEKSANTFVGYGQWERKAKILAIIKDEQQVKSLNKGDQVEVMLDETPFYAEGGGQIGDMGDIIHDEFIIKVNTTQSPLPGLNLCQGEVVSITGENILAVNTIVTAKVDGKRRAKTEHNHTATHLLQAALRTVIGDHVKQAGSLVNEDKLRFDFSHYAQVTKEQLRDVETLVNQAIQENNPVSSNVMTFDEAIQTGAMAIFGEKYGETVRVVTAGNTSKEFCGGCHTASTGNIALFKIVSEEATSAGIRRLEAITGETALSWVQDNLGTLDAISKKLKTPMTEVGERVEAIEKSVKEKDKLIEQLKKDLQEFTAAKDIEKTVEINGTPTLILDVSADINLKKYSFTLQSKMGSGVIALGQKINDSKISILIAVTKDLTDQYNAGQLIKELSPLVEGRGGGRPDGAQCGGANPAGWDAFKEKLKAQI